MKTTETYYAIRIGKPGSHQLYFMIRSDKKGDAVPWLFEHREDAEQVRPKRSSTKVVKIRVCHP
jgi:hypothetical protein